MWVSDKVVGLFQISKDTVDHLREDLAGVRAERDGLKAQLSVTQANFEWIRVRVNTLESERAQLIEKAYGIKVPVPEIVRANTIGPIAFSSALFEDVGDKVAKDMGLPTYGSEFSN